MIQLTDATVVVNNEAVGVVPNSVAFTEGLGEQTLRPVSVGDGKVEQVYAQNLETSMSTVKLSLHATVDNVALALAWKNNRNQNVVQIAGSTADGDMTRTFTGAALTANYEVPIGTEANIEIEFMANTAI